VANSGFYDLFDLVLEFIDNLYFYEKHDCSVLNVIILLFKLLFILLWLSYI